VPSSEVMLRPMFEGWGSVGKGSVAGGIGGGELSWAEWAVGLVVLVIVARGEESLWGTAWWRDGWVVGEGWVVCQAPEEVVLEHAAEQGPVPKAAFAKSCGAADWPRQEGWLGMGDRCPGPRRAIGAILRSGWQGRQ
jgi:hypothetical protein